MSHHADQLRALGERVVPILQDFGVTGFVLTGYAEGADGKPRRVMFVNTQNNPLLEDGLRPLIQFSHLWSQTPQQPPDSDFQGDRSPP